MLLSRNKKIHCHAIKEKDGAYRFPVSMVVDGGADAFGSGMIQSLRIEKDGRASIVLSKGGFIKEGIDCDCIITDSGRNEITLTGICQSRENAEQTSFDTVRSFVNQLIGNERVTVLLGLSIANIYSSREAVTKMRQAMLLKDYDTGSAGS